MHDSLLIFALFITGYAKAKQNCNNLLSEKIQSLWEVHYRWLNDLHISLQIQGRKILRVKLK